MFIQAYTDVSKEAIEELRKIREELELYILKDPDFKKTLSPHNHLADAPPIVRKMCESTQKFHVGPMASVAGAFAETIGEKLHPKHGDIVIENGGDIYVNMQRPVSCKLYAGENSPFTGKIKFSVTIKGQPYGICTSSGMVGHSLSFGKADAVTIISDSASDADAAATYFCNQVKHVSDVEKVIDEASSNAVVKGIIVAMNDKLGIWGNLKLL